MRTLAEGMVTMYANVSLQELLTLASLKISTPHIYPAFVIGTIIYLVIVLCNVLVFVTIILSKTLHKPMFILLLNLPVSDIIGATAFFPHFLYSIVTENREIYYSACVIQAFLIHTYGTANLLILSVMAYDRYIAICCPLRYNAIMGPQKVFKMIFCAYSINISYLAILFGLLLRLKICRTNIIDLFCNNPSLLKLTCEDTRVNNYYGIAGVFLLQGGSLSVVLYTYAQILYTCVKMNCVVARRKAVQTCGTHLVVFLMLQINTLVTIIAHRVDRINPHLRRMLGLSILLFPPFLDPLIYGLKISELRVNIKLILRKMFLVNKIIVVLVFAAA